MRRGYRIKRNGGREDSNEGVGERALRGEYPTGGEGRTKSGQLTKGDTKKLQLGSYDVFNFENTREKRGASGENAQIIVNTNKPK